MAMLVTLQDMKDYLGITDNTYDTFLTEQITYVSDIVENYCGRIFAQGSYVQTFYREDFNDRRVENLYLFHYPLISLTSVKEGNDETGSFVETSDITTDIRIQKPYGVITRRDNFFTYDKVLQVSYDAGYADIPSAIRLTVFQVVEGRYNKQISGVALDFGSDVQSVTIPGAITVAFDYTLQQNERKSAFGAVLGNNLNMLDQFRSGRSIVGTGRLDYVT